MVKSSLPTLILRRWSALWALLVLACAGCANGHFCSGHSCFPRIDPTGEHIFVHNDTAPPPAIPPVIEPAVVGPPPVASAAVPPVLPPVVPANPGVIVAPQLGVSLNPTQIVAPVGSEVIMIATIVNQSGEPLPRERVEWTISQGGVGQFVSPGQRGTFDLLDVFRGLPEKVNNTYVINSTVSFATSIDRGSGAAADKVPIRSGQAWVSVTSPVEGNTFVSAYSPAVKGWDRRQQTGNIYWIDAQWNFPPPAINPMGGRHGFTTTVTRQTDGSPIGGWLVRYEVTGGPDAGFSPDGTPVIEVTTDNSGQATAEIFQKAPAPGSNQVSIQVIRPAGPTGPGKRIIVGTGSTTSTWTGSAATPPGQPVAPVQQAPALQVTLRTTGPAQAGVGAVATYRIEVTNPAGSVAHDVVVTDQAPVGLSYLNSNPAADSSAGPGQEWRLGDLGPQESRVIEVNFRVDQAGSLTYCANLSGGDGLAARDCATTAVGGATLDVVVKGPAAAEVGTDATFTIEVTNRGDAAVTGVLISDRFDAGLEHRVASSPIEANVDQINPREMKRIAVTFHVTAPGQLCQEVTVTAKEGLSGETRSCISAVARPAATPPVAPPPAVVPPAAGPAAPSDHPSTVTPTPGAGGGARLSVRVTGPDRRQLDQVADFVIDVTNAGGTELTNVQVSDTPETMLDVIAADAGFVPKQGALTWTIASLKPGETARRRIQCKCVKESTRACNRVTVTADGGTTGGDVACLEIVAAGNAAAPAAPPPAAASKLTLSVADNADAIRTGGKTMYQIVITNEGAGPAKQVTLSVKLSPEIVLTEIHTSPVGSSAVLARSVLFNPIAEVRAGESITFELEVRADHSGTGKLHAEVTSVQQRTPIAADETTQILE